MHADKITLAMHAKLQLYKRHIGGESATNQATSQSAGHFPHKLSNKDLEYSLHTIASKIFYIKWVFSL